MLIAPGFIHRTVLLEGGVCLHGWIRSFVMMAPAPFLALFFLSGCTSTAIESRVQETTDPMAQAPVNHFDRWKPSLDSAAPMPDMKATQIVPVANSQINDHKAYDLPDLVDIGLRNNPSTKKAWEETRAQAAALGMAESAWLPVLAAQLGAGYWRYPFPISGGFLDLAGTTIFPTLHMTWTLFDRGRPAVIDMNAQKLLSSNLNLNRNHQDVVYRIQQAFYELIAAKSHVEAAEMTLRQSTRNADSIRAQLTQGLATQPQYLLAAQDQAKAAYELQGAHGTVMEKEAQLAEHLGIRPDVHLTTMSLNSQDLPSEIERSADEIIDVALENRPDLAARLAQLRAQDANIRKAEANYWPTFELIGDGGWKVWNFHNAGPTVSAQNGFGNVSTSQPLVDGYLQMNWNIFEGFSGVNSVKQAEAQRNAAQAEFDALQLKIMKEIWKAYADFKTSYRKREFAIAMLKASEKAYEGALKSYENGVATVIELITAERNLAQARYIEIDSKSALLTSSAALAFAAGSNDEGVPILPGPRTSPVPSVLPR